MSPLLASLAERLSAPLEVLIIPWTCHQGHAASHSKRVFGNAFKVIRGAYSREQERQFEMSGDGANTDLHSPLEQRSVQWTLVAIASMILAASFLVTGRRNQSGVNLENELRSGSAEQSVRFESVQIDINTAPSYELALLPGVGPVLADRIVTDREENGDFISVEDLRRVFGIGPRTIEEISSICVVGPKRR